MLLYWCIFVIGSYWIAIATNHINAPIKHGRWRSRPCEEKNYCKEMVTHMNNNVNNLTKFYLG